VASRSIQPFGHNRYGPGGMELGSHLTQCGEGRAYLHAKFQLGPSNRLATIHQRHRQTEGADRQRTDSTGRAVLQTVAQKAAHKQTNKHKKVCGVCEMLKYGRDEIFHLLSVQPSLLNSSWNTVLDGDQASSPKGGTAPNFRPMSIVVKRQYGSRCHLVKR